MKQAGLDVRLMARGTRLDDLTKEPKVRGKLNKAEEASFQQQVAAACVLAQQSLEEAFGEQRSKWMELLETEHDHWVELLESLLRREDSENGLRLVILLQELWFESKYTCEGLEWLGRFLALQGAQGPTPLRAEGLDLAGSFALNMGDYREAQRLKEEALSILRETGNPVGIAYTLFHLGHLRGFVQGDYAAARSLYQEGLDLLCKVGDTEGITHGLANVGTALAGAGDYALAAPLVAESLRRYLEMGSLFNLELSLRRAAAVLAGLGKAEMALRLAGASARHRTTLGVSEPEVFLQAYEQMLEPARRVLNQASQTRYWMEGAEMSIDEAVAYAQQALKPSEDSFFSYDPTYCIPGASSGRVIKPRR